MPRLQSINVSPEKGTAKQPVPEAVFDARGIAGDAHAGPWHRQVSLLSWESVQSFNVLSELSCAPGAFGENLTTSGLDLGRVAIRDRLSIGEVELEITQIGKACHGHGCAIYRSAGRCIMPVEGVFARVVRGGGVATGAALTHAMRPLRVHIVTLSDRASRGDYEDRSGPEVERLVKKCLGDTRWHLETQRSLLADDEQALRALLLQAKQDGVDAVFTTGGTGIGPRDITPEVVRPLLDKEIVGIMDLVRVKHGERLPAALLSRSVAGVAGQTLIYALPGSVRGVQDYMEIILPTFEHSLLMLHAIDAH